MKRFLVYDVQKKRQAQRAVALSLCCLRVELESCSHSAFPKAAVVPSAQTLKITEFSFSDFELSDLETALCTIRMFTDLSLVQNFQMKHEVGGPAPGSGHAGVCVCVRVCKTTRSDTGMG